MQTSNKRLRHFEKSWQTVQLTQSTQTARFGCVFLPDAHNAVGQFFLFVGRVFASTPRGAFGFWSASFARALLYFCVACASSFAYFPKKRLDLPRFEIRVVFGVVPTSKLPAFVCGEKHVRFDGALLRTGATALSQSGCFTYNQTKF